MSSYAYLIFLLTNIHYVISCGCYGSKSCLANGSLCSPYFKTSDLCVCDCCPPCNTCEQFLESNCLAHQYRKHYSLSSNQSTIIAKLNESIISNYIIDQTNGEIVRYLWDPCLRRSLPKNLYLQENSDGSHQLIGIAKEKLSETLFEIIFKGPVNQIILVNFTITII